MKSKVFLLLLFLLIALVSSCKSKHELKTVRTISFNTAIVDPFFRWVGTTVSENGEELVYFADTQTGLYIKTFDLNGHLVDSIPLKEADNFVSQFRSHLGNILFLNRDTILVSSSYYSHYALIDKKGEILKTAWIDDFLPDSLKEYNEYSLSSLPNSIESLNQLLLGVRSHDRASIEKGYNFPQFEYYEDYYKTLYNTPALLEVTNLFNDRVSSNFRADNYFKNISPELFVIESGNSFKYINEKIFILCREKGEIVELSGKNYEIIKTIKIKSDYSENTRNFMTVQKVFKELGASALDGFKKYGSFKQLWGYPANIFYHDNTKKYYVLLGHALKNEEEFKLYGYEYRPFSVFVYDKDFKTATEYAFAGGIYKYRNALMTSEGLMIQQKEQNTNINNYGTQTFDLLEFD